MKIAILNDTHCGVRNDMVEMSEYQGRFYKEVFFPYLDQNDIKHIIHMGDYFDRRKYINFASLQRNIEHFIKPMQERGITMDLIIGNHDTYYKNTNDVNSPALLLYDQKGVNVIEEPKVMNYDGLDVAMVPWINNENHANTLTMIENTNAQVCMGHLEVAGFAMNKGIINEHGISKSIFGKFDTVFSGHFHHKSDDGHIFYLGAPYEFYWNDCDDRKGFHVFDTETRELEFIRNPLTMFNKVHYHDQDKTLDDIMAVDFDHYKGSYVKLIVHTKTNPYWFDMFVDKPTGATASTNWPASMV